MKLFQSFFAIFILICCIGVLLQLNYKDGAFKLGWDSLLFWKQSNTTITEPEIPLPKQGVQSDELALRCLKLQLHDLQKKNIVFSPLAVNMLLSQWLPLVGESQAARIQELLASSGSIIQSENATNTPAGLVLTLTDIALPLVANKYTSELPRIPFSSDKVQALRIINNWTAVNSKGDIQLPLSTSDLSEDTKLTSLTALSAAYPWLHPMHNEEHKPISFYDENSSTGSYSVNTLQMNAPLRYLDTAEYIAVALFFESKLTDPQYARTCLLLLMPKVSKLRPFLNELTTEQLSTIRTQLASTQPREVELRLPSFQIHPLRESQKSLIIQLGLPSLFGTTNAFPQLSSAPCALQDVWQVFNFQVIASPEKESNSASARSIEAENSLTINRPFLWMLTDLSSHASPQLMGTIEKL